MVTVSVLDASARIAHRRGGRFGVRPNGVARLKAGRECMFAVCYFESVRTDTEGLPASGAVSMHVWYKKAERSFVKEICTGS